MSDQGRTVERLLGSVAASAILAGVGLLFAIGPARADCMYNGDITVCSGETRGNNFLNGSVLFEKTYKTVGPLETFGAYVDTVGGSMTVTAEAGSEIVGFAFGLYVYNGGTGATTITSAGELSGALTGLSVSTNSNTTDLTINQTGGTISGGYSGIEAFNGGTGNTSVAVAGTLNTLYVSNGITAKNLDIVQNGGSITGDSYGIYAYNAGTGHTNVTTSSTVQSLGAGSYGVYVQNGPNSTDLTFTQKGGSIIGSGAGALLFNGGTGDTNVTVSGTIGSTEPYSGGLYVGNYSSNTGDLTVVQTAGLIYGKAAIEVSHLGTGDTKVQTAGNVIGTISGIEANTFGGNQTIVQTSGKITGGDDGINSHAFGGIQTISVDGKVTGGTRRGIYAYNDTGTTTVTVGAGGRVSGGTYGIEIGGSGSTINASGRISGGSAAIWYNGSNNTLNVYNSARFNGAVDFNSTTGNTINFHTGSYTLAVEDYLVNSNQINVRDKSLTLITSGIDPDTKAGNIVVVDNKTVSASPSMVRDFSSGILGLVGDIIAIDAPRPVRTSGAPLGYADTTARPSPTDIQTGSIGQGTTYDAYGNLVWLRSLAAARQQDASGGQGALQSRQWGLAGGIDHQHDDWRFGTFGGGGKTSSTLDGGSGSSSGDIGLAGGYARRTLGTAWLDAVLAGGYIRTETKRRIGSGGETATGSFDGWFGAGELALATRFALGDRWSLTPSLKARYVAAAYDGYRERGSSQNVRYDAHTAQGLEQRFEAKLNYQTSSEGRPMNYWLKAAGFAQETIGKTGYGATVLDTDFTVRALGDRTIYGTTVGLGFDIVLVKNVSIFSDIDGTLTSDHARAGSVRGGMKVAF
ncbi:autotransporter family protein [Prosthecodimorpha staleyi]|uniref:Autotransporter domain-containing protein n=1 Tax=Prosthecodimorpha staleyi TaxID=2840188 RepID=A0A947D9G1_9HYPH|nr:autotransporter outer membrane beta-barrel domain-containing protein [Prosthecodimorpha staleyi]MBT9292928.1 autotransporter domain-containing protein [Prosthecodimorpha staleyi]